MIKPILKLGDPRLYEISTPIERDELLQVQAWAADLHDTLLDYRQTYGAGRAIAAPQIGIKKRLIYLYINKPCIIINPSMVFPDTQMMHVTDDCMSFPGLTVKVQRYKRAILDYYDAYFVPQRMALEGDLAELLQHEYDHLDGILATMRAVDSKAFALEQLKRDF